MAAGCGEVAMDGTGLGAERRKPSGGGCGVAAAPTTCGGPQARGDRSRRVPAVPPLCREQKRAFQRGPTPRARDSVAGTGAAGQALIHSAPHLVHLCDRGRGQHGPCVACRTTRQESSLCSPLAYATPPSSATHAAGQATSRPGAVAWRGAAHSRACAALRTLTHPAYSAACTGVNEPMHAPLAAAAPLPPPLTAAALPAAGRPAAASGARRTAEPQARPGQLLQAGAACHNSSVQPPGLQTPLSLSHPARRPCIRSAASCCC